MNNAFGRSVETDVYPHSRSIRHLPVFAIFEVCFELATTAALPGGARNVEFGHHCLQQADGDIEASPRECVCVWGGLTTTTTTVLPGGVIRTCYS